MRYTKYNIKKNNNHNLLKFLVSLMLTIVLAGAMGLGIAKVIFKILPVNNIESLLPDTNLNTAENTSDNSSTDGTVTANAVAFDFVQCGYFSNKDNATQALSKIGSGYGAFLAEDGEKYRVIAGIFTGDSAQAAIDNLKTSGVESVKVSVALDGSDKVQSQVAAICDGYIQILSTTYQQDVKSINTASFKEYVSKLDTVDEGEKIDVLKELKTYVSNLPEEIVKENISKEYDYLYNILVKFK